MIQTDNWAEELPNDCPPKDSIESKAITYFPLTRTNTSGESHLFYSSKISLMNQTGNSKF